MTLPLPATSTISSVSRPTATGLYDPSFEHDNCGVGFIAHIKGQRSHDIVTDALTMLQRMDHRGACGCETNTGDGSGILTALPHGLLKRFAQEDLGVDLPEPGRYAVGNIFLPQDASQRDWCRGAYEQELEKVGATTLGWRTVPVDPDGADLGPTARRGMPTIEQLYVRTPPTDRLQRYVHKGQDLSDPEVMQDAFERALYVVRNRVINRVLKSEADVPHDQFYICSLSTRVLVYKGQLTSEQVPGLYADLKEPEYISHLAMVHSRFSTNTFPSWDRAQPCRMMSHNGEINTLKGNRNWIAAREGLMRSEMFGDALDDLFPIVNPAASDSGSFDNVFEMLVMAGRSLPEAMMMMIPEAWENHESMDADRRAFYAYHANLMEPWDGPASVSFTDGKVIGATLDRNGLRPSRYYVTTDDRVIMASEVGVVDVPADRVKIKGRLQPGRMFLVDFEQGRLVPDEELKATIASARPYARWLREQTVTLPDPPATRTRTIRPESDAAKRQGARVANTPMPAELMPRLRALGYTLEHVEMLITPMAKNHKEPLGSMGNDQALAVLSDRPRMLYDYFKQLFAQVTNPPIDPIREEVIMSLATCIGPEGNLLTTTPQHAHRLRLEHPVLTDERFDALCQLDPSWGCETIDITFDVDAVDRTHNADAANRPHAKAGSHALAAALDRLCEQVSQAIASGRKLIVLSDKALSATRAAIPSLLAVGTVHHHLIREKARTQVGLILQSGEAREVHHFCCLFGFGADAVHPYLAYEVIKHLHRIDILDTATPAQTFTANYVTAIEKGILKVMSKMGISTLASYKGAQIFEAVGLDTDVMDRAFFGCSSRLRGVSMSTLAAEILRRHELGFRDAATQLENPGEYHWRPLGESHALAPPVIATLQAAARTNGKASYEQFARMVNEDSKTRCTLRGLIDLKTSKPAQPDLEPRDASDPAPQVTVSPGAIPLDEVEPAAEIVRRFRTGAMSLGALSKEAHETLALAMNRMGGMSNSGEGGEDPARYSLTQYPDGSPKTKRSAIKQIASGRFGVTSHYLANADRLQIKIAQGAKPGEGGQLPGFKVDPYIASIRHSTPGVGLISPPPHHDIYSIEDLSQLIFDLKNANPSAQVSVKLVAEVGVGTVAAGVAKAKADHILISGHDGGTGASPLTSIKHAGLPWELGLAETHQTLVMNDLRSRVRVEADGGMKTGRDVVIAACLGAEEFGFSTAPMITIGCIMMRKCHLNTCPVGVCTQDERLRKKFQGQPEHVINYLFLVAEEMRELMAAMGVATVDDLVGRVDLLEASRAIRHWKSDGLDLTPILQQPTLNYPHAGVRKTQEQDHGLDTVLDRELIEHAQPALDDAHHVVIKRPIRNLDRAVGAMLSHEVSKRYGEQGLPDGTIELELTGSAGQSVAAFLAQGISLRIIGDANDYVGKGLSGGRVIVAPPANVAFDPATQVVVGNVALYGATAGEAYFQGLAAERFAVRNSGAAAVVEGVGDHGCEYMTGGRVVILGPTGRNFAAGMSGGIAYVYDPQATFKSRCNPEMVDLESLGDPDHASFASECRQLIKHHHQATGSACAAHILTHWDEVVRRFVMVMPVDYRKVLLTRRPEPEVEHAAEVGHG